MMNTHKHPIEELFRQLQEEDTKSLRRIDGILDKRIRYLERRVWPMFGLAFVLIAILFGVLLAAAILSL
jgi:hypothetical protein